MCFVCLYGLFLPGGRRFLFARAGGGEDFAGGGAKMKK
jgi:hypothetical protein